MRMPISVSLFTLLLLAGCAPQSIKYDNTFAGVGADLPLMLPARLSVFVPDRIDIPDPAHEKLFLTRTNRAEADSFAVRLAEVLTLKGIRVDLHRFSREALPENGDLERMVSSICAADTARHSLVVGTLQLVAADHLDVQETFEMKPGMPFQRKAEWGTKQIPTLQVELHLYDHLRRKIGRSLRFGTEGSKEPSILSLQKSGLDPLMRPILREVSDTVRVR